MATIRKRGNSYQVQIRVKGSKPITRSFKDKRNALVWIKKTESEIERGIFLDTSEATKTTLAEVLDRYALEVLPYKKGGTRELSRIKTIVKHLGKYNLASGLTPSLLSQYRDTRLKEVANQTVKHELGLISRVVNHCIIDWGINLPHGNPVNKVRKPKLPQGRDRRLLPGEEELLISNVASKDLKPIILFALETAMRRSEIANIQWEHIDLKTRSLVIPETKTDTPRTIPLTKKAIEVLHSCIPRNNGCVVTLRNLSGNVFNLRPDSITQAFDKACKRANIENLRFHDLRHEATTRLFEKGLNPMEVSAITGHKSLQMLKRYTHLRAEDLVHKLDKVI